MARCKRLKTLSMLSAPGAGSGLGQGAEFPVACDGLSPALSLKNHSVMAGMNSLPHSWGLWRPHPRSAYQARLRNQGHLSQNPTPC